MKKGTGTTSDSGCTETNLQHAVEPVPFFIRPASGTIIIGGFYPILPGIQEAPFGRNVSRGVNGEKISVCSDCVNFPESAADI
jgi:hypothetical protein